MKKEQSRQYVFTQPILQEPQVLKLKSPYSLSKSWRKLEEITIMT